MRLLKKLEKGRPAHFDIELRSCFAGVDDDDFFPPFELAYIQYEVLKSLKVTYKLARALPMRFVCLTLVATYAIVCHRCMLSATGGNLPEATAIAMSCIIIDVGALLLSNCCVLVLAVL